MLKIKVSENFFLHEFVPKEIYEAFGANSIQFLHPGIPVVAQGVRDFFNVATTINNWYDGGQYNESGFRIPDTKTGARFSPHKRGIALDLKLESMTPDEVRKIIIANQKYFMGIGVTRMESSTLTWVHVDMAWTKIQEIQVFAP